MSELYALAQPLGKPLLRDGFTLVPFTIGNEELGGTLLPDTTGSFRYSLKVHLTQSLGSALSSILCMAGTKIGGNAFSLVGTIGSKVNLVNSVTPALENLR